LELRALLLLLPGVEVVLLVHRALNERPPIRTIASPGSHPTNTIDVIVVLVHHPNLLFARRLPPDCCLSLWRERARRLSPDRCYHAWQKKKSWSLLLRCLLLRGLLWDLRLGQEVLRGHNQRVRRLAETHGRAPVLHEQRVDQSAVHVSDVHGRAPRQPLRPRLRLHQIHRRLVVWVEARNRDGERAREVLRFQLGQGCAVAAKEGA
jgi:hypothetical protein